MDFSTTARNKVWQLNYHKQQKLLRDEDGLVLNEDGHVCPVSCSRVRLHEHIIYLTSNLSLVRMILLRSV
jgi:hypothetical protein